jgi:uncharacterized protein (TIGR02996 family)
MKTVQDRTELAFLRDICSNPADDSVRLIYADWLDERGLPGDAERAEFIRGQSALCCFPLATAGDIPRDCPDESLCYRLKWRVHDGDYPFLVPDWTETIADSWSWYGHGPQFAVQCGYFTVRCPHPFTLHWRRGFVEGIFLSLVDFQTYAARLFASHPVQHVTLTDKEPSRHQVEEEPGEHCWGWARPHGNLLSGVQQTYHLPGCLYDALGGWFDTLTRWRFYRTQAEAQEALSRACVRWGRQQAGLREVATS